MQALAIPELIDPPAPVRRRVLRYGRLAVLTALVCGAAYAGWQLTRPVVADRLADAMAPALAGQLGQGILQHLDMHTLQPSKLSPLHQARISAAFASLQAPHEGAPRHRLLFRGGRLGALAAALPSGDIILSDALVLALPDDGAVLAVLAHELGHLQHRHMLRRLVQEALLPATVGIVQGDMGWLVSSVSAQAPHLAWAQQAEIEADDYAADFLQHNGLPLRNLEEVQEALFATGGAQPPYLAIHPLSGERLTRLRERSGH